MAGFLLGLTRNGSQVRLPLAACSQQTYVLGKNGTGKTSLLLRVFLSAIGRGWGACLIDSHGELSRDALWRIPKAHTDRVIFWDLSDARRFFGLNLFSCHDPGNRTLAIQTVNS